ncbi:MAG: beta-galactosidase [Clostridia bacterium]|nr:beta-galactosidase [Clostridia bacterium]
MNTVEIKKDGFYIDGNKFMFVGGEFHYFRTLKGGWRRRLELMKDFGITVVTTYVPWNMHEPSPGKYCFEEHLDLEYFLSLVNELGMKVYIRPSPYMCGEFEFGGLPSWLLRDRTMCLRSSDASFMNAVERYYEVLLPKLVPYLHKNGGPIILAAVENEYGSFGNDKAYMNALADLMRKHGIDVPFSTCGGIDPFKYQNGYLEDSWYAVDFHAVPNAIDENLMKLKEVQPDKPLMSGEAWVGDIMFWGKGYSTERHVKENAEFTKKALELGCIINYYMFCGGTNFGFTSGALSRNGEGYVPLGTSYDYGAPVSEEGTPRKKYFLMRDALDEYLGKPKREHICPEHKIQAIGEIKLCEAAPLFDNSSAIATSAATYGRTICMEDLGQNFGFIRYTTYINYTDDRVRHLHIDEVADRATVYIDGKYIGCVCRNQKAPDIVFTIPKEGCELSVLVENMGRVGYGYAMYDRKGVLGCMHFDIENPDGTFLYNYAQVMGFSTETLPLADISALKYGEPDNNIVKNGEPCFWRGSFKAEAGVDTFIDMAGWKKGCVFINGFNVGKYWNIGSARTLYIPGELISADNVIEVFEIHSPNDTRSVSSIDHSLLCEKPLDPTEADFLLL